MACSSNPTGSTGTTAVRCRTVQGKIKIFHATEVLGASTIAAVADARTWLVGESGPEDGRAFGPTPRTE